MIRRLPLFMSLFFLCIFISGCFEVEEKISIAEAGSVDMNLRIRFPISDKGGLKMDDPQQKLMELGELGKGISGIMVMGPTLETKYGQTIMQFGIKADSLKALAAAYDTFPKEEGAKPIGAQCGADAMKGLENAFSSKGFYTISRKGRDSLFIRRVISEAPKKPKEVKKKKAGKKDEAFGVEMAEMMMAMMGGGLKLRFDLTVPGTVLSSNAESVDGNAMHWVIPIDYIQKNRVVLEAVVKTSPELIERLMKK